MFCAILRMLLSSSSGLRTFSASCSLIWSSASPASNKPSPPPSFLWRDRHVAGFVGRKRKRKAAQAGLHGVEAGGLGVDRDHAHLMRARDPFLQAGERAHALVFAAVDFLLACGFSARGGERDRGEGAVWYALAGSAWFAAAAQTNRRFSRSVRLRATAGAPDTSFASASTCDASISAFSATRRVMVLNSIAFRKAMRCL